MLYFISQVKIVIVYIKNSLRQIYASPVFAEIDKGWDVKVVVLNETGDGLILLPYLSEGHNLPDLNYFYVDDTLPNGWIEKTNIHGFAEIVDNEKFIEELKRGKKISLVGLQCVKSYNLPLPVITEFEIKTNQDIDTFYTVCWGLHDAVIEKTNRTENDITINFDTTWGKHIIMTFHNVQEIKGFDNLENFDCIIESELDIDNNGVTWDVTDAVVMGNDADENPYIASQFITWKLLID